MYFRRALKRYPSILDLVRAYVHTKLEFRARSYTGERVPLYRSLLLKVQEDIKENSYTGIVASIYDVVMVDHIMITVKVDISNRE